MKPSRKRRSPTLWPNLAKHILWNVEQGWKKKRMGMKVVRCAVFCGQTTIGFCPTRKSQRKLKEPTKGAETWDLEPKSASLWWSSTYAEEVKEDMTMTTKKDCTSVLLKRGSRSWDSCSTRSEKDGESEEERMQKARMVERRKEVQKQRCLLENLNAAERWSTSTTSLCLRAKVGLGVSRLQKRLGDKHCETSVQIQKKVTRKHGLALVQKTSRTHRTKGNTEVAIFCRKSLPKVCGELWGWACDQRPNAGRESLGLLFPQKSTCWRKNMTALNMLVVPSSVASEWVGAEVWAVEEKRCTSKMDVRTS